MKVDWGDRIVAVPEVLSGKPRIIGTQIPVSLILGYLAAGYTHDYIIKEFPDLKQEHILVCFNATKRN